MEPHRSEKTDRQPPFAKWKPWLIMAEESTRGNITVRHALTGKMVKEPPPSFHQLFHASKLSQELNFKSSKSVIKVLNCSTLDSMEVVVLYDRGALGKLSLENEVSNYNWKQLELRNGRYYWCRFLDDIVSFKDMNCAVDRMGRLYMLEIRSMTVATTLISETVYRGDNPGGRRKRLVIDPATKELLLVVRESAGAYVGHVTRFKVYKFNQQGKRWDVVESIGNDRILFVGINRCFFANAKGFPGCIDGNSIVFSSNCFRSYNGRIGQDKALFSDAEVDVGLYRYGEEDHFTLLSSEYSEFAKSIWPPPKWFLTKSREETDADSSGQQSTDNISDRDTVNRSDDHTEVSLKESSSERTSDTNDNDIHIDDEMKDSSGDEHVDDDVVDNYEIERNWSAELDFNTDDSLEIIGTNQHASEANISDDLSPDVDQIVAEEQTLKKNSGMPFKLDSPLSARNEEGVSGTSRKGEPSRQTTGEGPEFTEESAFNTRFSMFQGAEVKSELIPTLDTIVAKRGDLIDDNTVRSKKMLASALEVLAELVNTLQNTTGRTLTEKQANNMRWNLSHIQRAGLKVDWLEPVIEKATRLQKSKSFVESIAALEKKKAEVDEEEKKFLARSAKVKQEIEEDIACLSTRIPFPDIEVIDLDDCLGQGI